MRRRGGGWRGKERTELAGHSDAVVACGLTECGEVRPVTWEGTGGAGGLIMSVFGSETEKERE